MLQRCSATTHRTLLASLVLLVAGCPKPPDAPTTTPLKPAEAKTNGASMPSAKLATLIHNGEVFWGKPPLKTFYFDATLRNDQDAPRWLLLPQSLPGSMHRPEGGIDNLEIFQPKGENKVIAIDLMGTYKLGWAFLLPPKSEIIVKRLPIEFWGDLPTSLELEVVSTAALNLNGKPIASYLKQDPTCDVKAEVSFDKSRSNALIESYRFNEDYKEVPIQYTVAQQTLLSVPLKPAAP